MKSSSVNLLCIVTLVSLLAFASASGFNDDAKEDCCNRCMCTKSNPPKCWCTDMKSSCPPSCTNCECTRSMFPTCWCSNINSGSYALPQDEYSTLGAVTKV